MVIIRELWRRRSLLWDFAMTDLKIRYRNSVLGFLWSFLEPLLLLSVLYFVFTYIIKSHIEHFALYLLLGIIIWNVLSRGTTFALNSIVGRSHILTQIYFPREIMAISPVITTAMMLCFELIAFGAFIVVFQFIPPVTILLLIPILGMLFFLVLGLALPLSVLNAYYRDVQFIWAVVLQAGFFIVPIFYTLDLFPETIRTIIMLNPMAQIVNMSHNVVLFGRIPSLQDTAYTLGIISLIFVVGYLIFRKLETRIVEEL